MTFHLKSLRSVGAHLSPTEARGPALVASPGKPAPVHIKLVRPTGYSGDQCSGRAIATGGMRRNSGFSSPAPFDLSTYDPLEGGDLVQSLSDRSSVFAALTVEISTAVLFVGSLFLLFFCSF
jgi:hypothetical protein